MGYTANDKAMVMGPRVSAFLSICGSSYIIWDVLKKGQLRSTGGTHHRLLLGMSVLDVFCSLFGCFTATWWVPADTPVWGASGNQATCNVQGFFAVMGVGVAVYNGALSVYYLAKIRLQIPSRRISSRWEPFLHGIPWIVGLGTATAALLLKQYNRYGWNCWIANYPYGCAESWKTDDTETTNAQKCIRGDNASTYAWIFFYDFLWASMITVSVNMFLVWRSVYTTEKKMAQYNFQYQQERDKLRRQQQRQEQHHPEQHHPEYESNDDEDDHGSVSSHLSGGSSNSSNSDNSILSHAKSITKSVSSLAVQGIQAIPSTGARTLKKIKSARSKRKIKSQNIHFKHSRKVACQGYWFSGAFYLTWIFPTILTIMRLLEIPGNYPLYLITACSIPLQGFSNFLIYIYPRLKFTNKLCCSHCCGCKHHTHNASAQESEFTVTYPNNCSVDHIDKSTIHNVSQSKIVTATTPPSTTMTVSGNIIMTAPSSHASDNGGVHNMSAAAANDATDHPCDDPQPAREGSI